MMVVIRLTIKINLIQENNKKINPKLKMLFNKIMTKVKEVLIIYKIKMRVSRNVYKKVMKSNKLSKINNK